MPPTLRLLRSRHRFLAWVWRSLARVTVVQVVQVALMPLVGLSALPARADIVIAQVSPQDGYLGFYTRALAQGARAAIEAANAHGGVLGGQSLRFVQVDDAGDPRLTAQAYESLAAKEAPVAFLYQVGPASIVHLLEKRLLDKLQVPLLGTIPAVDPFRTPVRPYVFHLRRGDEPEIEAISRHLVTVGLKRLSVLYLDDPAGRGALPIVKREVAAAGGALVHTAPVQADPKLGQDLIDALRTQQVQAVLLFMPADTAGGVVARLRDAVAGLPIYSVSYLDAASLVAAAGRGPARGVAISQAVPNPVRSNLPLVLAYRRDMAKHQATAGLSPFTLEGYIAARVLIEAVKATRKPHPTGRDVQAALEHLVLNLEGLPVNFRPDTHIGLNFIDMAVIGDDGLLRY